MFDIEAHFCCNDHAGSGVILIAWLVGMAPYTCGVWKTLEMIAKHLDLWRYVCWSACECHCLWSGICLTSGWLGAGGSPVWTRWRGQFSWDGWSAHSILYNDGVGWNLLEGLLSVITSDNTVHFTHKRHPMAYPCGQAIGCLHELKVWSISHFCNWFQYINHFCFSISKINFLDCLVLMNCEITLKHLWASY